MLTYNTTESACLLAVNVSGFSLFVLKSMCNFSFFFFFLSVD